MQSAAVHCPTVQGADQLVAALAEGLDIRLAHVVADVTYRPSLVRVATTAGDVFTARCAVLLITVLSGNVLLIAVLRCAVLRCPVLLSVVQPGTVLLIGVLRGTVLLTAVLRGTALLIAVLPGTVLLIAVLPGIVLL